MDVGLLEDALALIEEGTLSAAAHRRNVTQPAFSRRIRALEHWLGQMLVERHANKVELTSALVRREDEIRLLLERLRRFRDGTATMHATFVIGAQHSLATSVFPELFPRITQLEGVKRIRLRTRNQNEIVALFLKSELDMMLSYQSQSTPRLPFDETVAQRIWRRDTLVPVVGGPLRFELSETLMPDSDTPTLSYPDDSEFGRIIQAHARADPVFEKSTVMVETAFAASVVSLIKLGAGIGWVPQSLIRDDLRRGEIVPLSASYGRIPIDVVLSTHRDNARGQRILSALVPDG